MSTAKKEELASFGRRLLAAMVLAKKSAADVIDEVGADLDIRVTTLQRMTAGRRAPRKWEIPRLAAALDVPEWFLESGFSAAPADEDPADLARMIAALDKKLDVELDRRLSAIEDGVSALRREVSSERAGRSRGG